jgi:hypothetical protein
MKLFPVLLLFGLIVVVVVGDTYDEQTANFEVVELLQYVAM